MGTSQSSFRHLAAITAMIGWSEFKLRYAGSALGYFWSVSKPLILFAVLYTVFSNVLRIGAGIPHYPIMLLIGIVMWTFFSETTQAGTSVLVAKADLLRKVSFPSVVLPISVAVTAGLAMAFNVIAVFVFVLANGLRPNWNWVLLVPLTFQLVVVTVGITLILSAMYVYFRDVGQIWDILSLTLFYLTPIVYPLQIVPDGNVPFIDSGYKTLMLCNPLAQIIEQTKRIVIDGTQGGLSDIMTGGWILVPYAMSGLIVLTGVWLYSRVRHSVVERL